jgi:hypothetical protein
MRQGERLGNGEVKRHCGQGQQGWTDERQREGILSRPGKARGKGKACIGGENDTGKIRIRYVIINEENSAPEL